MKDEESGKWVKKEEEVCIKELSEPFPNQKLRNIRAESNTGLALFYFMKLETPFIQCSIRIRLH